MTERFPRPETYWLLPGGFAAALAVLTWIGRLPVVIPVWYLLLSAACFLAYGHDKQCAQSGKHRLPESTLHLLELIGGWPGAWVAQPIFRHKTRKTSYQVTFWAIVAVHLFGLTWWCWPR